jgi:uncharacterized protein YkwD
VLGLGFGWLAHYHAAGADSKGVWLGEPPPAPTPAEVRELKRRQPAILGRTGPFVVDISSREQVRLFHQTVFVDSEGVHLAWTGNAAVCDEGATSAEFQDAVVRRINYFRALAGIPADVGLDATSNAKDQQAALMMSVNDTLSHFPPASWICYSADGAEAARNSNLAIGRTGPGAIDGYMEDFGAGNAAVGHRRWLLYPQTQTMGTGDVPGTGSLRGANAVWVFDGNYGGPRPPTRDDFVAWPPPGYVPYPLVYPRWSLAYPDADFSQSTVSFSSDGVTIPVSLEPRSGNIGENTLVWYPASLNPNAPFKWPRPSGDTAYEVDIRNVRIGGAPRDFNYTVIVFDPAVAGPDTVLPRISGPVQPAMGQANAYQLDPAVPAATAHEYRASQRVPFTAVDGAENGLSAFTVNVSPGYAVLVDNPKASGQHAFHLAHPTLAPQHLMYLPVILTGPDSRLEFKSRLGWATDNQVARAQVLVGGVGIWQDVYTQPGSGGAGENTFVLRSISLAPFAGRSLQVRFVYDGSSGTYYPGADPGVGWYLDDITLAASEELRDGLTAASFQGAAFNWMPPAAGDYALEARAVVFGDYHAEWGPSLAVTAVTALPPVILEFRGVPTLANGFFEAEFAVENYRSGLTFVLLRADNPETGWVSVNAATFETITPDTRFLVRTPADGSAWSAYYRVRAE